VLDIMVTLDEPDTRTAPPLSPAVESLKTELCSTRLEATLLDDTSDVISPATSGRWNAIRCCIRQCAPKGV